MSIFYDISCYSTIFIYFCKKTAKRINPADDPDDTFSFFDIYETWIKNAKTMNLTTESLFMQQTEGILKLYISENLYKSKTHIRHDEKEYSIISGIYISPYTLSITQDNKDIIDGLLMDTTWKLLPNYVTSILMFSICNVGIPIAFCFGNAEKADLYDMFFKNFNDLLHINLSQYVIESDKGTALASICSKYNCKHLGCLKHFLTSLGLCEFSKEIGELVSAKCHKDFDKLREIYSKQFSQYIHTEKIQDLQKILAKAGLVFNVEKNTIDIANHEIWESISQIERINFAMPSTTNALESTHGHLNADIPRRNEFWSAMMRLVQFVLSKENNFSNAFKINFMREKRLVIKTAQDNSSKIKKQIEYYHTNKTSCECGETKLISKMLRCNIPCSHMYDLTHTFPEIPDTIHLNLKKSGNKLNFICEQITTPIAPQEFDSEKKLKIKRLKLSKDILILRMRKIYRKMYPL